MFVWKFLKFLKHLILKDPGSDCRAFTQYKRVQTFCCLDQVTVLLFVSIMMCVAGLGSSLLTKAGPCPIIKRSLIVECLRVPPEQCDGENTITHSRNYSCTGDSASYTIVYCHSSVADNFGCGIWGYFVMYWNTYGGKFNINCFFTHYYGGLDPSNRGVTLLGYMFETESPVTLTLVLCAMCNACTIHLQLMHWFSTLKSWATW